MRTLSIFILLWLFSALSAFAQTADFSADKVAGCDPLVVTFTNKSTGASSYSWDFGDFTSSTLTNPSKVFSGVGTYTVKLTAKSSSGSSSVKTMTITVYPVPAASYTATPLRSCPCSEVNFNNTSKPNAPGAYTSFWSFGDGGTDAANNPKHTYCTPGKYTIGLKVTNSYGCVGSRLDTDKIEILEKPEVTFSASKTNLCKVPDSVEFTAFVSKGVPPYSYSWNFGIAGTSTAASPKIGYALEGSFDVELIVTDLNGCKDTLRRSNYITVQKPRSNFKVPASICAGTELVRFDNRSTPDPISTTWTCSDGGTGAGGTYQRDFWKGGTYTVTMVDNFGPGCIDSFKANFTVYPKPNAVFSYWPIYPCPAPATIHFKNHSRGADSLFWIFGDGTVSKATDPDHIYTKDSVFTVWLIAKSNKGCLDTFRVRDTSYDFPGGYPGRTYNSKNSPIIVRVFDAYLGLTGATRNSCIPDTVQFSSKLFTNVHLPLTADTTKGAFCAPILGYNLPYWPCRERALLSDPYPDDFYDAPDPDIAPPYYYPYKVRTYRWDFGDGSPTSSDSTPVHIYTAEGRYRVKLTVTTDSCTFTDSIWVEAGDKPLASFTVMPDTICKNGVITATRVYGRGLKYFWDWGDTGADEDTSVTMSHRYTSVGTRIITLTAERYGCIDTMTKEIVVNPPSAYFNYKYSCDSPKKISVFDSSIRATSWEWDFGDGATASGKTAVHIYADTGVYRIRLVTRNDSFSCSDTAYRTIHLYYPITDFSVPNACKGDTVKTIWTKPSWVTDYNWSSAGIETRYDTVLKKYYSVFRDTGVFTFTLKVLSDHNCWYTFTKTDVVKIAKPRMKLSGSPLISCFPNKVTIIDSGTNVQGVRNVSRTWYWGDATTTTDTGIKASKSYSAPGSYRVNVVTTDAWGCKDTAYIDIEQRKPKADFVSSVDTYSCIGKKIVFRNTATGTGLTFRWDFGDGNTSTASDPIHSYAALGVYDVTLWVTDATGCKDSIVKKQFIKLVKPVAGFYMNDSTALCPPLFVACVNTSTNAISYLWRFAGGSTSVLKNPTVPYITPGVYPIILVAYDIHGCTDTATGNARLAGYDGAISYGPLSGCAPLTVDFKADVFAASELVWDFADGVTLAKSGVFTTTHTYEQPGAYVPRIVLGDGKGCTSSSKGKDTIKVDGVKARIDMTPACINTPITFSDSSTSYFSAITATEWQLEDGTKLSGRSFKKTYPDKGKHRLRLLSINGNGCRDSIEIEFEVRGLPEIRANDTVICLGDMVALSASGGTSYYWYPDTNLSCAECPRPITNAKVPRKFVVRGTDAYGCSNLDTLDLGIKYKTTLIVSRDEEVCARTPIRLIASGAHQYYWNPETYLDSPRIARPLATADSSILYRIIGVEGACIPDTGFLKLTVFPLPGTDAGADQKVLAGTEVQLQGSSRHGKVYRWEPADRLVCADCAATVARPLFTTNYVLVSTTEHGCVDSDSVRIVIFCDQSQLYLPNTFTPNGDGVNDYFYPQGKGIAYIQTFTVFNRWGQKVFERKGMEANVSQLGWDGNLAGAALGPDTYVYILEATCDNGEPVFLKGDVTLIR
jgi:gliding motility-associated-like protein